MERAGAGRTVLVAVVIALVVLAAGVIGMVSWYNGTNYVRSGAGQVGAPMAPVGSLVAGTLTSWSTKVGDTVTAGQTLGQVAAAGASASAAAAAASPAAAASTATPAPAPAAVVDVRAPFAGTIVQSVAVTGETVAPGAPLAYIADLSAPTVTAFVKETDIRNVRVGQTADVYVDALPNTTITGTVQSITLGTASTFSLLPAPAPSGSLTKVTQYVPVVISLSGEQGQVLPGESASVRIHIR